MVREKLAEKGIGQSSGFRWRSHEITRIEGFSDAVFAFAVTLLVVSLEVPRTFDELSGTMQGFLAFALASAILFVIWYNQYKFFRRYGLQDVTTITLNAALLFVVLYFVYPLKFLFNWLVKVFTRSGTMVHLENGLMTDIIRPEQTGELMVIYGLGYVAVFGIFVVMYIHALRRKDQLALSLLEEFDTRTSTRELALQAAVGVASVTIAFIGGNRWALWSGLTYMLIGPVLWVHGSVSRRKRRKLESLPT